MYSAIIRQIIMHFQSYLFPCILFRYVDSFPHRMHNLDELIVDDTANRTDMLASNLVIEPGDGPLNETESTTPRSATPLGF